MYSKNKPPPQVLETLNELVMLGNWYYAYTGWNRVGLSQVIHVAYDQSGG